MAGIRLILEISPAPATQAELVAQLNDRIRDLGEDLKILVASPSTFELDMGAHKIVNVTDPSNDLDVVNLRTLKKFGSEEPDQLQKKPTLDAYTIVFTKDGNPDTLEDAPSFTVDEGREGVPLRVWFRYKGAPVTDASFNMKITEPKKVEADAITLLSEDVVIPAGTVRTVFSKKLAYRKRMAKDTIVDIVIVASGGGSLLSAGLIVGRQ